MELTRRLLDIPAALTGGLDWLTEPVSLAEHRLTVLVFWMVDPHSKRALPRLAELYRTLHGEGLDIIAFTHLTRRATRQHAEALITSLDLPFPMAHDPEGRMREHYQVTGLPIAVLVRHGEIRMRVHPANLSEARLRGLLDED